MENDVMGSLGGWLIGLRKGIVIALFSVTIFGGMGAAALAQEGGEVLKGFTERQDVTHGVKEVADKRKHQILFIMGIALLVGILVTAGLGIAMALFGKEVFLAHMLSAGFSVILAVHAQEALVQPRSDDAVRRAPRWARLLVLVYFFAGLTSIAYEVLGVRMLGLQFGASIFGVIITVAAFMAGLGGGSLLGAVIVPKLKRPLLLFAALEAAVAVYAWMMPTLFRAIDVQLGISRRSPIFPSGTPYR